ncbi:MULTISPECIES: alpha/beta hydrolase [unclassified Burkholderia]|uniref:alpha/beta fold hydrolase n=1 Tax=unclassified Burkholderia TaxID=2613784 RepID=UPI001420D085|nr:MULTISPECIES: alpha/beta hydrolase [unclassified Burkholderia]NIE84636.1 alpha/beta hydrolase [Burkholderia sp. Tr-860]NIF65020.1 alpha/beta hydrolase [Burkholderia sp. Cy-647]NIF98875.1 alpha/beta hydrolase [Burkholderia sp. Ax-1720]
MSLDEFVPFSVTTAQDVEIVGVKGGAGPPLLLLHGHPQTHRIWHRVAGALARHFSVIATDLRGYGASAKPPGEPDHANYSKRAMAADQLAVMRHFGHERFCVCAHDRGARVAHRLALDHGDAVERMMLLDIAPTLAMYEKTDRAFATAYFHWFFLIQPAPLPETLIGANPDVYVERVMGGRSAGLAPFAPEALEAYRHALRQPGAVHAMCEDYRASATIDLEHDRADLERGTKLACPLRVLWGAEGVVARCFDPLEEWRAVARDVSGRSLDCGHYIPEEAPEALLDEILSFFEAGEMAA